MAHDERYVWICSHFEDEGNLTPLGLQMKGMLARLWENARGNGGKLTRLGELQHQGIAHRMFEHYPQIFAAGHRVQARSSVVDRCAKSMLAFTSELHTLQPQLKLDVKTDSADMAWIAYESPELKALKNIDIAFLPVNQPYTMTVDQAVEAVKAIRPTIFYPYHYGEVEEKTDIDRLVRELEGVTEVRIRPME